MQILKQACGTYETNCYILSTKQGEFIIDPGFNACDFVKNHTQKPLAVLNTHGHFDHVWDNAKIRKEFKIPIYIHKNDAFFLQDDPFNQGFERHEPDFLIEDENEIELFGVRFRFHFLPGHTPGCTMIELVGENLMFSGDFLFLRSIGRWDFPYSNADSMKQSLEKIMGYKEDYRLLPGHGDETSLKEEQKHLPSWLKYF